jgi:hypothetical protein
MLPLNLGADGESADSDRRMGGQTMQIVTDSGTDLRLSPEQMGELQVHVIPLIVTLGGRSYREGVDIQADEFYRLLAATDSLPVTSQPSAGSFAEIYRRLAATDPNILMNDRVKVTHLMARVIIEK